MQYPDDYVKIFNRLKINEGGFQIRSDDHGNWTGGKIGVGELRGTNCGISAATYPDLDIENLTEEQIMGLYYEDWYVRLMISEYPKEFRYQIFDSNVHHGSYWTAKILQRAVGVNDDGIIGQKTWDAVNNTPNEDITLLFLAKRCRFIASLSNTIWNHNSRGFVCRIAKCLEFAAEDN